VPSDTTSTARTPRVGGVLLVAGVWTLALVACAPGEKGQSGSGGTAGNGCPSKPVQQSVDFDATSSYGQQQIAAAAAKLSFDTTIWQHTDYGPVPIKDGSDETMLLEIQPEHCVHTLRKADFESHPRVIARFVNYVSNTVNEKFAVPAPHDRHDGYAYWWVGKLPNGTELESVYISDNGSVPAQTTGFAIEVHGDTTNDPPQGALARWRPDIPSSLLDARGDGHKSSMLAPLGPGELLAATPVTGIPLVFQIQSWTTCRNGCCVANPK